MKDGWWPLVRDLYNHDVINKSRSDTHNQLIHNLTFTDLYMATGHNFTDFIVESVYYYYYYYYFAIFCSFALLC